MSCSDHFSFFPRSYFDLNSVQEMAIEGRSAPEVKFSGPVIKFNVINLKDRFNFNLSTYIRQNV